MFFKAGVVGTTGKKTSVYWRKPYYRMSYQAKKKMPAGPRVWSERKAPTEGFKGKKCEGELQFETNQYGVKTK